MTTEKKLIKNKLGLLELATYLMNVSEASRVMGVSRDTFFDSVNETSSSQVELQQSMFLLYIKCLAPCVFGKTRSEMIENGNEWKTCIKKAGGLLKTATA